MHKMHIGQNLCHLKFNVVFPYNDDKSKYICKRLKNIDSFDFFMITCVLGMSVVFDGHKTVTCMFFDDH